MPSKPPVTPPLAAEKGYFAAIEHASLLEQWLLGEWQQQQEPFAPTAGWVAILRDIRHFARTLRDGGH